MNAFFQQSHTCSRRTFIITPPPKSLIDGPRVPNPPAIAVDEIEHDTSDLHTDRRMCCGVTSNDNVCWELYNMARR